MEGENKAQTIDENAGKRKDGKGIQCKKNKQRKRIKYRMKRKSGRRKH